MRALPHSPEFDSCCCSPPRNELGLAASPLSLARPAPVFEIALALPTTHPPSYVHSSEPACSDANCASMQRRRLAPDLEALGPLHRVDEPVHNQSCLEISPSDIVDDGAFFLPPRRTRA